MKLLNCWEIQTIHGKLHLFLFRSLDPLLIGPVTVRRVLVGCKYCLCCWKQPGESRWFHWNHLESFQVVPGDFRCFRVIQIFVARGSDLQQEGSFSVTLSIPPLALSSACPLPSAASNFILKSGNLICFGFFLQWHGEKRKLCWNRNLHILSILASHPASQPLN